MSKIFEMDYREIEFTIPHRPPFLLIDKVIKIGGKGPLQKFNGLAEVDGNKMAEADLSAMVVSAKA